MEKRGFILWDTLIPWVIVIAIVVLSFILYLGITGRLDLISDFFEEFMRFGR